MNMREIDARALTSFDRLLGSLMVAAGQQTSCFVAIERNTRSTFELLKTRRLT